MIILKLNYDTPTLEIIKFQADDIIVTSYNGNPGGIIPEMPWEPWP